MIFIDTDNAMGASHGDVDDGFAIAALLSGKETVAGIGSVFGNTSEEHAFTNNQRLGELLGYEGPYLRSAEVARFLSKTEPLRVVAIGPLTNVAAALEAGATFGEIVVVGANTSSAGRWPPVWPFEFNLTKDRSAARRVFSSEVPLTIVPLDVARGLRAGSRELSGLQGPLGRYLRAHSTRWLRRAHWLHISATFPVWDLVAAIYVTNPELFDVEETGCRMHGNGWVDFSRDERPIRLVRGFDPPAVWRRFLELVNRAARKEKDGS